MRNPTLRVYKPFVDAQVPHYHVALVRDESVPRVTDSISINCPEDAVAVCEDLRAADREHFEVLLLSTKNNLIARVPVSIGCLNATVVHPREVFKAAIVANACSVILVHNHPSGCANPSLSDRRLFDRMTEAGRLLGIEVADCLIIGGGDSAEYFSLAEERI